MKASLALVVTALLFPTAVATSQSTATDTDRFQLLHEALSDLSTTHDRDVMTTIGLLLLTIGWIVTSERSRQFFRTNLAAYRTMLAGIVATGLLHIGLSLQTLSISHALMERLIQLNYVEQSFYEVSQVKPAVLVSNLAFNLVLFAALFVLIWAVRANEPRRDQRR